MVSDAVTVTGATGTVGRHVVAGLAAQGVSVRAACRHPAAAGLHGDPRVQHVRFSFGDPTTWTAAFTATRRLFLVRPPELVQVTRVLVPAVSAARDAGVEQVVFLSVLGAEHNPLLPHRRIERWLETSGMAATHLRAGNFMQNLAGPHTADIRDRDELVVPAGDAAMSYVDARDVAAVAVACLLGHAPTRGAWDLTGPAAITHTDVAAALSAALDRPIRYTRPSLPRYWTHARSAVDMPPGLILATSLLYCLARVGIGARVSDDIPTVLHRPAHDIHRFAADHRDTWAR